MRHSPLTWRAFDLGFSLFRTVFIRRTRFGGRWPAAPDGVPLLLVANHVSWWDGFLLREVQRRIRGRAPFHTVVIEHQISAHPMLGRLGAVPVDPTTPASVLRMLRTLRRLRAADPGTVFSYFPQGRIWPSSRRPLEIRRGIEAVTRVLAPVRIVPVGIHIEPLVDVRPTPLIWLGEPLDVASGASLPRRTLEERMVRSLDQIRTRLDAWGEDVLAEWPDAHGPASRAFPLHDAESRSIPDVPPTRPTPS
ncbi:MAG TPA: 1-acyl-sn-glycerol-3-phosphate acyltransferase [Longimicrobiales bacterium]|nr:1-acyl-sn-glycerol-3-phosphate acyltransferase [Longimicrobiales bacterium]